MEKEKKIIKRSKLILASVFLISIVLFATFIVLENVLSTHSPIFIFLSAIFGGLAFFDLIFLIVANVGMRVQLYEINSHQVIVYTGWLHTYIKLDGEIVDKYVGGTSYHPVYLSTKTTEGDEINVTVSTIGLITLKLNGKLLEPTQK